MMNNSMKTVTMSVELNSLPIPMNSPLRKSDCQTTMPKGIVAGAATPVKVTIISTIRKKPLRPVINLEPKE